MIHFDANHLRSTDMGKDTKILSQQGHGHEQNMTKIKHNISSNNFAITKSIVSTNNQK